MTAAEPRESPLLSAALAYVRQGWHIFPLHGAGRVTYCDCGDAACPSPAKHPWTRNGLKDASVNGAQIERWWGRSWPSANVGVACGASGLVVLDVDPRHGGDLALVELVKRHSGSKSLTSAMVALASTLISETGGGGEHYVFRAPAGVTIRNTTDLDGLRGLDVRAAGGYFVAPPSMHVSGARYLWRDGVMEPRDLPAWLLPVLTQRSTKPQAQQPVRMFTPPRDVAETGAYWLERALHLAHEGNRNDQGFWLACQLRDSGLSEDDAAGMLETYAARVPGVGYTVREALLSVRSAYRERPRERARSLSSLSSVSTPAASSASAAMPAAIQSSVSAATLVADEELTATPAVETVEASEAKPLRYRLLTDEQVEALPPPDWLIGGVIVADTLSVLYGEYGSYKSFLALDWALCIATQSDWCGQSVKQGRVVYVAGEGIGGLGKRLRAWKVAHGWQGSAPIHLLGEAPQLLRAGDVTDLQTAIAALPEPPAMIVIDTLARSLVGGDENSAQDMGVAVAAAEAIRASTGAAVVLIHHKPKGTSGTRGSSALPGAVYTSVEILKDEQEPELITVHCEKQKDFERFADRRLRFEVKVLDEQAEETSGVLVPDDAAVGPRQPKLPPSARGVLTILQATNGLAWGALKQRAMDNYGMSLSAFNKALNLLDRERMVENVSGFWRATER